MWPASGALLVAALVSAGGFGASLGAILVRKRSERERRRQLHRPFDGQRSTGGAKDSSQWAVDYLADVSRSLALGAAKPFLGQLGCDQAREWLDRYAKKAGLGGEVTPEGLVESMARLGLGGAVLGALAGAAFSTELALLLGLAGLAMGAMAPTQMIKRRVKERAEALERSLAEMLEVVALGLRSGLSFDRSFELYGQHFDTEFARSCTVCQQSWSFGLATREEALGDLAASYDSELFERVVQSIVRSLRFGSSLAENLEEAAEESRAEHRARVEEKVAKAPVKMMLPTAGLILPAMLLLVLGPVLLEMMEGF